MRLSRLRSRVVFVVVASVAFGLGVPLGVPLAHAIPTCTYNDVTEQLDVGIPGGEVVFLSVDGDEIAVMNAGSFEANCGDVTPTRQNTENIVITAAPSEGLPQVLMLFSPGEFVPGATDEGDGTSEIEFQIAMGVGQDTLSISGSSTSDDLRYGSDGVNINGDDDVDVTFTDSVPETHNIQAADGNDEIRGDGSGAAATGPFTKGLNLDGGPGDDTLIGGSANDIFSQESPTQNGAGADTMVGGESTDQVRYTTRTAGIVVTMDGIANDGDPTLNAGAGEGDNVAADIESVITGTGDDHVTTGPNGVSVSTNAGSDEIDGGPGDDSVLDGGPGADNIDGGDGADRLNGGTGTDPDVLTGGPGLDHVTYLRTADLTITLDGLANDGDPSANAGAGENDNVDVENVSMDPFASGADTIVGNSQDNIFNGGSGADTLEGGDGADWLIGGQFGNTAGDTLIGGPGADRLDGGLGIDTIDYSTSPSAVAIDLATRTGSGGDATGDEMCSTSGCGLNATSSIENVVGSNDTVTGDSLTGDAQANTFDGGDGPDTIVGNAGIDTTDYSSRLDTEPVTVTLDTTANDGESGENDNVQTENITGGAGGDFLTGDASGNRLTGGPGDDEVAGLAGADILDGGTGSDRADYRASSEGVTVNLGVPSASGGDAAGDTVITATGVSTIENVAGSLAAGSGDTLTGNGDANILSGLGGNDTVDGRLGADLLFGGDGVDTVTYADRSNDLDVQLDGVGGNDDGEIGEGDRVHDDFETLIGGSGNDSLEGTAVGTVLRGGLGNDQLTGLGGEDTLDPGDGADTVDGGGGNDQLRGGNGPDPDVLDGGTGDDLLTYPNGPDAIHITLDGVANDGDPTANSGAGEGDDVRVESVTLDASSVGTVIGNAQDNTLTGGNGADTLVGGDGNDTLVGNASSAVDDDTLEGGAGADNLNGRNGSDTIDYSTSSAAVTIDLATRSASGGDATGDEICGTSGCGVAGPSTVENVIGSDDAATGDSLTGDGQANTFDGGDGPDTIIGAGGIDTTDYESRLDTEPVTVTLDLTANDGESGENDNVQTENITGGAGGDFLTGDGGANMLRGGPGDDELAGLIGADSLDGGDGSDTADYRSSLVGVTVDLAVPSASGGDADGDVITAPGGISTIENVVGGSGNDRLTGDAVNNELEGGAGNDVLNGLLGGDVMDGGPGVDTVSYAGRPHRIVASIGGGTNDGANTVGGPAADEGDDIKATVENITGGNAADVLVGNVRANRLVGARGNDRLSGGGGPDVLLGVTGNDTANGGPGRDRCVAETESRCET